MTSFKKSIKVKTFNLAFESSKSKKMCLSFSFRAIPFISSGSSLTSNKTKRAKKTLKSRDLQPAKFR